MNTTFDGINVNSATNAQLFAVADEIVDATDVDHVGLVTLKSRQSYVTPNSFFTDGISFTSKASIQRAISAASAGDTINVAAGTYQEDLVIDANKSGLQLTGAGSATTTIQGVAISAQTDFPLVSPNISILASGVQIHGFTIASPTVPAGSYSSGVVIGGQNVSLYNNAFLSTQGDAVPNGTHDGLTNILIQTSASGAADVDGLNIHDNRFIGNGKGYYGIDVRPQSATINAPVTVTNNVFTGNIWSAINVERSRVVVEENVITPGSATVAAWGGSGIAVGSNSASVIDNVVIHRNQIDASQSGIFGHGLLVGFGGDTLTNMVVSENIVRDQNTGIDVHTPSAGITVVGNLIAGNTAFGLRSQAVTTIDAHGNWWGQVHGPTTTDNSWTSVVGTTTGDTVSGTVNVAAWLNIGTDTDLTTPGFQPASLDTVNPTTTLPDLTAASDTGVSDTDNVTSDSTPAFQGSVDEAGALVSVGVWIDSTLNPGIVDDREVSSIVSVVADAAKNWSATIGELADGTHILVARATDTAGNVGAGRLG